MKPMVGAGDFIEIVLSNVGPEPALNVGFQPKGDKEDLSKYEVTLRGTSTPISFISPGESEVYFLGTGFFLFGNRSEEPLEPLKPFPILIEYEDADRQPYRERITLDIRQFEGLEWHGTSPAKR